MKSRSAFILTFTIIAFIVMFHFEIFYVHSQGNAEVSRKRNIQYFEMTRVMNTDVIRLRNYQYFELSRTMNIDVTKLRNYQYFELARTMNADVLKLRNIQYFEMTTPPYEYVINITKIIITDQEGNPKTNFVRGSIIQFEITIKNLGSPRLDNGLISIVVCDPSETPVLLAYKRETIHPNAAAEIIMGYRISETALNGIYTLKVVVLTDWPARGGIGLATASLTFTVS